MFLHKRVLPFGRVLQAAITGIHYERCDLLSRKLTPQNKLNRQFHETTSKGKIKIQRLPLNLNFTWGVRADCSHICPVAS